MLEEARRHLKLSYPELVSLIDQVPDSMLLLSNRKTSTLQAVVHTICEQMLSAKAANTIFNRLIVNCENELVENVFLLDDQTLRDIGLSRQKTRTIRAVENYIKSNGSLERWSLLPEEQLLREITSIWGLSDWSARMLVLSHFGLPDSYPLGDGTLSKVHELIESKYYVEGMFEVDKAAPYRSYLARAMWAFYDLGMFDEN